MYIYFKLCIFDTFSHIFGDISFTVFKTILWAIFFLKSWLMPLIKLWHLLKKHPRQHNITCSFTRGPRKNKLPKRGRKKNHTSQRKMHSFCSTSSIILILNNNKFPNQYYLMNSTLLSTFSLKAEKFSNLTLIVVF